MHTGVARGVLVALVVLAVAASVPAGAIHDTGDTFTVRLEADGDATVVFTETFNLTNESERAAFERLQSNETARQQRRARFRDRLGSAASAAGETTGRRMNMSGVSISVNRTGEQTGVLRMRARWTNLAAVESSGDRRVLVVTEPFADGFEVNRTLAVRGPDGFRRGGTSPPPMFARRNLAMWGPDQDLGGFEAQFVEATDTETATATATTGGGSDGGDGGEGPAATPPPGGAGAFVGAAAVAFVPAALVALGVRRARGR